MQQASKIYLFLIEYLTNPPRPLSQRALVFMVMMVRVTPVSVSSLSPQFSNRKNLPRRKKTEAVGAFWRLRGSASGWMCTCVGPTQWLAVGQSCLEDAWDAPDGALAPRGDDDVACGVVVSHNAGHRASHRMSHWMS